MAACWSTASESGQKVSALMMNSSFLIRLEWSPGICPGEETGKVKKKEKAVINEHGGDTSDINCQPEVAVH